MNVAPILHTTRTPFHVKLGLEGNTLLQRFAEADWRGVIEPRFIFDTAADAARQSYLTHFDTQATTRCKVHFWRGGKYQVMAADKFPIGDYLFTHLPEWDVDIKWNPNTLNGRWR